MVGSLSWDDPTSILAWLDAYDPSKQRGVDVSDDGPLTQAQLNRPVEAVEAFVQALSGRCTAESAPDAPDSESAAGATHNDIELACHEVLRRMRGPSRPVLGERLLEDISTCDARCVRACAPTGYPSIWS